MNHTRTKEAAVMAHFRATIQGARGEASRLGHKNTGITTRTNGWDIGAFVKLHYDKATDRDILTVVVNRGSGVCGNGRIMKHYIIKNDTITEL